MNLHLITYIFLCLNLLSTVTSETYRLPPSSSQSLLKWQRGHKYEVKSPEYNFKEVYSRTVLKSDLQEFPPCHSYGPQVEFSVTDHITFQSHQQIPLLVYNYDDIFIDRSIVDMYIDNNNLYLILSNGYAAYFNIIESQSNNSQINYKLQQISKYQISGMNSSVDHDNYVSIGYFVKIRDRIVFTNSEYMIEITKNYGRVLGGYLGIADFSSVTQINEEYLAVLSVKSGVKIYRFADKESVAEVGQMSKIDFVGNATNDISFQDLAYWSKQKILFVLDQFTGVKGFKVTLKAQSKRLLEAEDQSSGSIKDKDQQDSRKTTEDQVKDPKTDENEPVKKNDTESEKPTSATQTKNQQKSSQSQVTLSQIQFFEQQFCGIMHLNTQHNILIMACSEHVLKLELKEWPRIQSKVLPDPGIFIKEILTTGNLIGYVGNSAFKLTYSDLLVDYFEDYSLEKLLMGQTMFISTDQGGVSIGRYHLNAPSLVCEADEKQFLGRFQLLFSTAAECQDDFFNKFQISLPKSNLTDFQQCVYNTYQEVKIWEPGQVNKKPIAISIIILMVVLGAGICLLVLNGIKFKRMKKQYEQFSRKGGPESAKYMGFNEQMGDQPEKISEQPHKMQSSPEFGSSEQQFAQKPSQWDQQQPKVQPFGKGEAVKPQGTENFQI